MCSSIPIVPATSKLYVGLFVPIPTYPPPIKYELSLELTCNEPDSVIVSIYKFEPDISPHTCSSDCGIAVPIPT